MAAAQGGGAQAIENQLKICGFKRNVDVLVLYLAGQGLRSIPSLSRFHRLRYLWINNNKIQDLSFLVKNHCLTELYLNNNEVTDISDGPSGLWLVAVPFLSQVATPTDVVRQIGCALKHLCALQILLLHNNQLKHLDKTVEELKGMRSLQTLNIFHNPLAQDPDYRLYVIHFLPSVQLLDRKPVTPSERQRALHVYDGGRSRWALQAVAFGRRLPAPPGTAAGPRRAARPARSPAAPPGCEFGDHTNKVPLEDPADAVFLRAMTRSVMEFSSVDWNKVSTCQERRLENKAEEPYETLTVRFR